MNCRPWWSIFETNVVLFECYGVAFVCGFGASGMVLDVLSYRVDAKEEEREAIRKDRRACRGFFLNGFLCFTLQPRGTQFSK